jgi:hypothetical protein
MKKLFYANPFIRNKNKLTPREIAQKNFEETGSLNCKK